MSKSSPLVLILGAGINGAALARELALGGIAVWIVDVGDVARGATSYSSRLVHGGLRYLEYGEWNLVRESLAERDRLLKLAPDYVRPLAISIPVSRRLGGITSSAARFFGRRVSPGEKIERGLWIVRAGLAIYDLLNPRGPLPRYTIDEARHLERPPVDPDQFPWLCTFHDAQVEFPERLTVALFADSQRLAAKTGVDWRIYTYHTIRRDADRFSIHAVNGADASATCQPNLVVNATGSWVDATLGNIGSAAERLMGGTKGSHVLTLHHTLRQTIGSTGLYIEARDGRPIFVLPFGPWSLIGTTDQPYVGDPAAAVASPAEIEYLLDTVNSTVPGVALTPNDIGMHYAGVRPLPFAADLTPAAVTRRHAIVESAQSGIPIISLVGGKLTTCRSLAEEACGVIRRRLGLPPGPSSRTLAIPANDGQEVDVGDGDALRAGSPALHPEQAEAIHRLIGTRNRKVIRDAGPFSGQVLHGTSFPEEFVRWVIRHEWPRRLADLVERRLMLLYDHRLSRATLNHLAELAAAEGMFESDAVAGEVERVVRRLSEHYGRRLPADSASGSSI